MEEIYLDNAATTSVFKKSAEIAYDVMLNCYGNPSSVHRLGFSAEMLLKNARRDIMASMGADERNYTLTFTASGTEADNLAILGTAKLLRKKGNKILMGNSEHPAVFECKSELEAMGYEVLLIPNKGGEIDFDFVEANLSNDTVLITHMLVNNETGAEYNIKKLCRIRDDLSPKCIVHTDAVQGYLKTEKKLISFGADIISVSAHKIHGPKGIGALLSRKSIRISPIVYGGGQENGLRSGTEALPFICAFANSAKEGASELTTAIKHVKDLKEFAVSLIRNELPEAILNIFDNQSDFILSVSIPGIKSEVMLRFLSEKGIYISAGSACSSKHRENRVLTNFGLSPTLADTTLRISFCSSNTFEEIEALVFELKNGYKSLAKIK